MPSWLFIDRHLHSSDRSVECNLCNSSVRPTGPPAGLMGKLYVSLGTTLFSRLDHKGSWLARPGYRWWSGVRLLELLIPAALGTGCGSTTRDVRQQPRADAAAHGAGNPLRQDPLDDPVHRIGRFGGVFGLAWSSAEPLARHCSASSRGGCQNPILTDEFRHCRHDR